MFVWLKKMLSQAPRPGNLRSQSESKRGILSQQKKPKKGTAVGYQRRTFASATNLLLWRLYYFVFARHVLLCRARRLQARKIHRRKQRLTLRPRRVRRVTTSARAMDAIRIPKVLHRTVY